MSEELKPCPFCGGNAMFLTITNKSSHSAVGVMFKIKCMKCGTELPKAMNVRCTWIRTEASEQGKTSERKQLQIGTGGQTMRLIDADALKKDLKSVTLSNGTLVNTNAVLYLLEEYPTAYDVDKVVEQLGKIKESRAGQTR